MFSIGTVPTAHSHANLKLQHRMAASEEEVPEESGDRVTLGEKVTDLAEGTIKAAGGAAMVAVKSSNILASSALQAVGVEEETADKIGNVAGVLTWGVTVPVSIMGSGVVGSVAVKGMGLGDSEEEASGVLGRAGQAYAEQVDEAYTQGSEIAELAIDGVQSVGKKAGEKAANLGRQGLEWSKDLWNKATG